MVTAKKLSAVVAVTLLATMGACGETDTVDSAQESVGVPTFQADPGWPILPPDFQWGQVIGIAADSRGHVWTSSRSEIAEWDPEGNLVQSWSASGPDGNWSVVHGLFVDHMDYVWTNARESNLTLKFTRDGQHVLTIGRFDETGGQQRHVPDGSTCRNLGRRDRQRALRRRRLRQPARHRVR